jgi:hypothetical protein
MPQALSKKIEKKYVLNLEEDSSIKIIELKCYNIIFYILYKMYYYLEYVIKTCVDIIIDLKNEADNILNSYGGF